MKTEYIIMYTEKSKLQIMEYEELAKARRDAEDLAKQYPDQVIDVVQVIGRVKVETKVTWDE